jgi:hypothetical protein
MEHETVVAKRYDVRSWWFVNGVDLFALEWFILTCSQKRQTGRRTLTDWLMNCQPTTLTIPFAGFNIPAVTTKFV